MCTSVKQKEETNCGQTIKVVKKLLLGFLKFLIVQIHCIFDCVVDFLFGLYYNGKSKKLPPVKNSLLLESACSLAEKIRSKKISSEEVVKAFVERSKEIHEIINAVTEEKYDEAIEEAKKVDEFLKTTNLTTEELKKSKPFLGVPFTTKDSHEAKGFLNTMGLLSRRNHRADQDATVIGWMKDAGAILIATTNVPELNLWVEARNSLYGQTNNPYDTTRTVGGSSGGEGAMIASCGSPISVASDIGGSTRIPAFCNGVFGFKPTEGLTPIKGIGLREKSYVDSMAEVGPICKKAEDITPLLKLMIKDKISEVDLDEPVNVKDLNIFYQECSGDIRTSKINHSMRKALAKAVQHFRETVDSVTKIKIPGSEYSYRLWRYWMTQEVRDFKIDITNGRYRANATAEILKMATGRSEFTLAPLLKLIDSDYFPQENSDWARNITEEMKLFLTDKLGENGVLLYPSAPTPAVYHYEPYFGPFNFGYFCLFNVLRFPVCQVPLGLDENGLPVGIQVVASPFKDRLCIAVAKELEQAFGGWVPPS